MTTSEPGPRAQVFRVGVAREGDPQGPDPTFVPNAIAQFHHHWIDETLAARPDPPGEVRQALVVFGADDSIEVRVNEEADYVAVAGVDDELVAPGDVFVRQITSIWPAGVDPDLGWVGYVTAEGGRAVVADFRRNREAVQGLLVRASEFLAAAEDSVAAGRLSPAADSLFGAAELAVMTMIQLQAWRGKRHHRPRQEWLESEIRYSDVPSEFGAAFSELLAEHNTARYGERELRIDGHRAAELVEIVRRLIDYAAAARA